MHGVERTGEEPRLLPAGDGERAGLPQPRQRRVPRGRGDERRLERGVEAAVAQTAAAPAARRAGWGRTGSSCDRAGEDGAGRPGAKRRRVVVAEAVAHLDAGVAQHRGDLRRLEQADPLENLRPSGVTIVLQT